MIPYFKLIVGAITVGAIASVGWGIFTAGKLKVENELLKTRIALQGQIASIQDQHRADVIITEKALAEKQSQLEDARSQLRVKPRVVTKFVPVETQCMIPKGFVDLHNGAAEGSIPTTINPEQPTTVTLTDVAETVATNYIIHEQTAARLEALQQIVRQYQERARQVQ